jgi:hypothetical protein
VQTPAPRLSSRRAFLRGVVAAVGLGVAAPTLLAGCDIFGSNATDASPTPELDTLLAHTVALGHEYDVIIAAVPALATRLTPLRDAHRAHAEAVAAAIGRAVPSPDPASPAPQPTDSRAALDTLLAAEKAAQAEALAVCISATDRLAPLLGSVAAACACHQEVLS